MLVRLARAVLAVALLFAGQTALLHPLEHVDKHGALVHVGDGQSRSHDGSDSSSGKLCDVLASLMAFVSGPIALPAVTISAEFQPAYRAGELRISGAPPFLSQGPPTLL